MKRYLIIILFFLTTVVTKAQKIDSIIIEEPKIPYVYVKKTPQFIGGSAAFYQFLSKNIMYPDVARKNNIQGTVIVTFDINTDGTTSNIRITKGVSPDIDAEAIRLLKMIPKWIPSMEDGNPVKREFDILVKFSLSDNQ